MIRLFVQHQEVAEIKSEMIEQVGAGDKQGKHKRYSTAEGSLVLPHWIMNLDETLALIFGSKTDIESIKTSFPLFLQLLRKSGARFSI